MTSDQRQRTALALCLITAVSALVLVWLMSCGSGDLFIAFAGGRDVVEGRLGQPDDWSFHTEGRVWINQNWGAHLILYGAHALAGDTGLALLKLLLILGIAAGLFFVSREVGAGRAVACLTAALVLLAVNGSVDLRPDLFTLFFSPWLLWLLLRSRSSPHRIWPAVALLALWANAHGGFVFGLGLTALWALCSLVAGWRRDGLRAAVRRLWPLPAAFLAALALAGVLTPFGTENLTHPFVIWREEAWRSVAEWQPLLVPGSIGWEPIARVLASLGLLALPDVPAGPIGEYLVLLGVTFGLAVAYALVRRRGRQESGDPQREPERAQAVTLLVWLLAAVVVWMGFAARRFIPLAMVMLTPILARSLQGLLTVQRRTWPTLLACVALFLPVLWYARTIHRHYRGDNPLYPPESFAQRMITFSDLFPVGAAQLLNAAGFVGRIYNEWEWEGFLHWECPQLRLWIGGRAQQVYRLETYLEWQDAFATNPRDLLEAKEVSLLVMRPQSPQRALGILRWARESGWVIVYYDERTTVVARADHPDTRALVAAAGRGELAYPDEQSAAVGRIFALASQSDTGAAPPYSLAELGAILERPLPTLYALAAEPARALRGRLEAELLEFFAHENERLAEMSLQRAEALYILESREVVAGILAGHAAAMGNPGQARKWRSLQETLAAACREARESGAIPDDL
jgi:hypothetical protein